jgi:hypothetical protein
MNAGGTDRVSFFQSDCNVREANRPGEGSEQQNISGHGAGTRHHGVATTSGRMKRVDAGTAHSPPSIILYFQ